MKLKTLKLSVLALIVILCIASCKKEEEKKEETNNPPASTGITMGTFRAKVNGELLTAKTVTKNFNTASSVLISGVGGATTNIFTLTIGMGDFTGIGTYKLGVLNSLGLGINGIFYDALTGAYSCTNQFSETSGEVVVTEFTDKKSIKGTFHFNAKKQGTSGNGPEMIDITDGEFYISLE